MHIALSVLLNVLAQYGYPALFLLLVLGIVGLPVPDETLLTFCGYLIYRGKLDFGLTLATALAGSVCGISISYWLGVRFGGTVVSRFGRHVHLTANRALQLEGIFRRFGPVLLTVGYFIPGVRHFTAVVAGMSGIGWLRFAIFAYLGAAIWVGSFVTLGFAMGEGWQHSSEVVRHDVLICVASLTALAVGVWIVGLVRRAMLAK